MLEIEGTDEFAEWFGKLDVDTQEDIAGALDLLADQGPQLGRPLVDALVASRHANMKELRPSRSVRIVFAFDPRRKAILLLGGDKRGQWERWYTGNIPIADTLYDEHIETLKKEGLVRADIDPGVRFGESGLPSARNAPPSVPLPSAQRFVLQHYAKNAVSPKPM